MGDISKSSFIIVKSVEKKELLESMGLTMFKEEKDGAGVLSFYFVNEPRKLQRVTFDTGEYIFTNKLNI